MAPPTGPSIPAADHDLVGVRSERPAPEVADGPASARRRANHLDADPDVWPATVRSHDPVCLKHDRGRDNERVGESETIPVASAQFRRLTGDLACGGLDGRRNGLQEVVDRTGAHWALTERCDEDLSVGRSRDDEPVPAIADSRNGSASTAVMPIVRIQDGDQDPGVENGQVHSRRRSSR